MKFADIQWQQVFMSENSLRSQALRRVGSDNRIYLYKGEPYGAAYYLREYTPHHTQVKACYLDTVEAACILVGLLPKD